MGVPHFLHLTALYENEKNLVKVSNFSLCRKIGLFFWGILRNKKLLATSALPFPSIRFIVAAEIIEAAISRKEKT